MPDELGYLPFSPSGGVLLFLLLSNLQVHQRGHDQQPSVSERSGVFGNAKITTALLYRITHHCHILETDNGSFQLRASSSETNSRKNHPLDPTPRTRDMPPNRATMSAPSQLSA